MSGTDPSGSVLVVDDEEKFLELYANWLNDEYTVRLATSGEEALEQYDESVSVVLLDRRMSGMDGRETLAALREHESSCRVAMVTAVEPELDVLELGFDEYVVKPTDKAEILDIVETLFDLESYYQVLEEYFRLASKRATIEYNVSDDELAESDDYTAFLDRLDDVERRVDRLRDAARSPTFDRIDLAAPQDDD